MQDPSPLPYNYDIPASAVMAAAPGYEYETLAVTWLSDGVMSVSPLRSAHAAQPTLSDVSRSGSLAGRGR